MAPRAAQRAGLVVSVVALASLVSATAVVAQQAPAPAAATSAPNVGQIAPDFSLPGATRYGLLKNPVRLSGFRGQTVVLAFFIRARTKG